VRNERARFLAYFLNLFLTTRTIEDDVAKIAFIPDRIEGHLLTAARTAPHSSTISENEVTYLPSYDDFSTVRAYEAYESIL